jgi:hypothetical protein
MSCNYYIKPRLRCSAEELNKEELKVRWRECCCLFVVGTGTVWLRCRQKRAKNMDKLDGQCSQGIWRCSQD